MAPEITVHHLDNSRSTRVVWLLEELGDIPYDLRIYPRHPKTLRAPPELQTAHPLGRSPIVHIKDQGETYVLAESSAIIDFILEHYGEGRLAPSRSDKRRRSEHDFWMHYCEAGPMFPAWARMLALRVIGDPNDPGVHTYVSPMVDEHLAFIDDVLSKQRFFGGEDFSAADIAMGYTMINLRSNRFTHINDWLDRVTAREAFKRTVEKSGNPDPRAFTAKSRKESKL